MENKLLIVGLWVNEHDWEFCGIFDNKQQALSRCTNDNNFISTAVLNSAAPEEKVHFEELFYPLSGLD